MIRNFPWPPVLFSLPFVLLGLLIMRSCQTISYINNVEMPAAYQAWVKMSGNTNHLTYDEWKLLVEVGKRNTDTTIIFIPH